MKRIYLLLLLLGCAFMGVAQGIRYPFVEEGKIWLTEEAFQADFENPEYSDTLQYSLQGDTLIAGKTAKKMFREAWGGFSFKKYKRESPAYTYEGAFYEEGESLYWCRPGEEDFALVFDCTCVEADVLNVATGSLLYRPKDRGLSPIQSVTITKVDHPLSESSRRVYYFEGNKPEFISPMGHPWIEGIGCVSGVPHQTWEPIMMGWRGIRLISCSVGGRMDYVLGLPTPPLAKEGREVLHSLDGRRLAAPPQQGIYLRNGKKVVK